jgi:hypothetical protein
VGLDPEVRNLLRRLTEAAESIHADVQILAGKTIDKQAIIIIVAIIALVIILGIVLDNPSARALLDAVADAIPFRTP